MKFAFLTVLAVCFGSVFASAWAQAASCPGANTVLDVPGSTDPTIRATQRGRLIAALQVANSLVRLGPNADFDFSDVPDEQLPIHFARCVTLTSVAAFAPVPTAAAIADAARPGGLANGAPNVGSARTPGTLGPLLRYGSHPRRTGSAAFLEVNCDGAGLDGEGARISGFRLIGPSLGDQSTDEVAIRVRGCLDVDVSNMEIAGWGGSAVGVDNPQLGPDIPQRDPPDVLVTIHDNFIHNDQHSSNNSHAAGYGVDTGVAGWSRIYNNVFDNNRHSITAGGFAGGYSAEHNLVLKGGGFHGAYLEKYIHVFDVHGTANCPDIPGADWTHALFNCGDAGRTFSFIENTLQFTKTTDIKIRGKPKGHADIERNVFARSKQDAAIDLNTTDNVTIAGNNVYDADGFGQYGVCDFDGDGVDDLFMATGQTWWFSSGGKFAWSFLQAEQDQQANLRFGYFDGDAKCDVLVEHPSGTGQWFISSGGRTGWKPLGDFGHPLSEVQLGRFNPSVRDHRPNVTRPTTDAFWRRADGHWFVTSLAHVDWHPVQSSSFPWASLRFGDFNGDGVTDVLAVEGGHWSVSDSATGAWRTLNRTLSDPVGPLFIGNMDADDNIDDILRLDRKVGRRIVNRVTYTTVSVTWWRSRNGTEPWTKWQSYDDTYPTASADYVTDTPAFVGRFNPASTGAALVVDPTRIGHFHSAAGTINWVSLFNY